MKQEDVVNYKAHRDYDNIGVICYSKTGEKIAEYNSLNDVEQATGFNKRSIGECYEMGTKTAYGYIWIYKGDELDLSNRTNKVLKRVCRCTLDGNLIEIHDSMTEAAKKLGPKHWSGITLACKGRQKTAHGYKWMYEEDYNEQCNEKTAA